MRNVCRPGTFAARFAQLATVFLVGWVDSGWHRLCAQIPDVLSRQQVVVSLSQQFVVHRERQPATGLAPLRPVNDVDIISLEPNSVVISCERIKGAVLDRLGLPDRWKGKIHLFISPDVRTNGPINILPDKYAQNWTHRVYFPEKVPWQRFSRAVVEVLLLEICDRESSEAVPRPPLWLTEGLSGLIENDYGRDLVAEPHTFLNRSRRRPDSLAFARAELQERPPMSFSEIGQFEIGNANGVTNWNHFRASAQLLVYQLLESPDTRGALIDFLRIMPQHLNWQTAMLRAFQPRFLTLLDIEKWWALTIAGFEVSGSTSQWSRERVLGAINQLLSERVEIRDSTNSPPRIRAIPLTEIIETWNLKSQFEVLGRKATQFRLLATHVPQDLFPLISEYVRTLDKYVSTRRSIGIETPARGDLEPRSSVVVKETVRKLQQLERRMETADSR